MKLMQDFHTATAFLTLPSDDSADSQAKREIWQSLQPIQRALLATDGSFTLLLAALYKEEIKTKLMGQEQRRVEQANAQLLLEKGDPLLERTVMLVGAKTGQPVTYAESLIAVGRLSMAMRRDLEEGSKPIGLLLRREALETHRVLQDWGVRPMPRAAAETFGDGLLLFRTYQIIARAMPIMVISEYFPYTKSNKEGEV